MARLGEKHQGMTVPQFGGWDHKAGVTNYSMVFSQARAKKKRTTSEYSRFKPNPDKDFVQLQACETSDPFTVFHGPPLAQSYDDACVFQAPCSPKASQSYQKENSKRGMKRFLRCFTRCMRR